MTDVFISYRRTDGDFVRQLHQELADRGISAWFDRENIEAADHWRSSIAEGIRACTVFVLVLSPEAVKSVNIRKEVDLAEDHNKKIVPLVWQETEIPVAFEYALAGIQWIIFNGDTSAQKFDELAGLVKLLLGGASMAEATRGQASAAPSPIPPLEKEPAAAESGRKLGGRRTLKGLQKKARVNPAAIGGLVISGVVTTFGLDVEDQDFVNGELKWLFNAAAHMLAVGAGQLPADSAIPVPPPPEAELTDPQANNKVLPFAASLPSSQIFRDGVETVLEQMATNLKILNSQLLRREADLGAAAVNDAMLQAEIKGRRLQVIDKMKDLAQQMNQVYGIYVTSPNQLHEIFTAA